MSSPGPGRPVAGPVEKPKDFKKTWGNLLKYCRPFIPSVAFAMFLAVGGAFIAIIGPDQISRITNLIQAGFTEPMNMAEITHVGFFLGTLYLIAFLCNYGQGFIMARTTQRISRTLREDIVEKINKLPLKYFDSNTTGDILSRVTNDVDTISNTLNQSIVTLASAAVLFIGTLIMMFVHNGWMALSAILSTILGFAFMAVIMAKSQKYFAQQQVGLGQINGHIEEIYSGHNVVRAYTAEQAAREVFDEINEDLYESAWKSQFLSGLMMPVMSFVGNLGYVVVCIVGAILAMNGYIGFGTIVAFMIYIRLFTQPLSQFAQAATSLQSTAAASERVFDFMGEEELADESKKTRKFENVKGDVSFRDVKFGYNPDKLIIKGFSQEIKAGQKVAIVGPTGAGKTTMVNLLMRFYELNSGDIQIDGISSQDVTRQNVHEQFTMVLQDTWLFEGSVKENLAYNKEGVTDADIKRACKAVSIDHFIRTLPNGYNTILDDKTSLSVGQKQLLTIARALINDAPLLILDEATSSVDTRTEVIIQAAMDKLMQGRTSFIIAHRLSTIKNADLILFMKDGDIVESGTHEELLAKGGMYAELYNSQFESDEESA